MVKLNPLLKTRFKAALRNYHQTLWRSSLSGEIDFIIQTVRSFQKLNIHGGKQSLKTRSKKIHSSPQVRFYRYGLLFPGKHTTVEMGDLFFIYKHFLNGVLDAFRGIIVQAKYTKGEKKLWNIDSDQFYFLAKWPSFRMARPAFKKIYSIRPRALTWATYGFVGPNATRYPLYYSSTRMLHHAKKVPSTKSFSFPIGPGVGWDSSTSFLLKLVQGLIGENLLSNTEVKTFVDDLYAVVKWKPDPPGEPEWNDGKNEENEGFGVVEFTVTSQQNEK